MRIGDWFKNRDDEPDTPTLPPPARYEDFERSVVLYSNFRTGSHFLKLSLARLAGMTAAAEPLNPYFSSDSDFDFPGFVKTTPEATLLGDKRVVIEKFFSAFYDKFPRSKPIILDIKYEQAFSFGVDAGVSAEVVVPKLASMLHEKGMPFLHLIRRDVIAQTLSGMVAAETGQYTVFKDKETGKAEPRVFRFSPPDVLKQALDNRRATTHATAVLNALGVRYLPVFYEDLTSENWRQELRRVFRFLDIYAEIPAEFSAPTRRQNSLSRVANLDEITAYIQDRDPMLASGAGNVWTEPAPEPVRA